MNQKPSKTIDIYHIYSYFMFWPGAFQGHAVKNVGGTLCSPDSQCNLLVFERFLFFLNHVQRNLNIKCFTLINYLRWFQEWWDTEKSPQKYPKLSTGPGLQDQKKLFQKQGSFYFLNLITKKHPLLKAAWKEAKFYPL